MKAGVLIPQGWLGEYSGWLTPRAYERAIEVAARAEELGFESVWVNDHLTPEEPNRRAPLLESFVLLTGVASATRTIRMGHLVICAGYRNSGMTLKMITTLDAASRGRVDLGLGAGWKRDDWVEFGYGDLNMGPVYGFSRNIWRWRWRSSDLPPVRVPSVACRSPIRHRSRTGCRSLWAVTDPK